MSDPHLQLIQGLHCGGHFPLLLSQGAALTDTTTTTPVILKHLVRLMVLGGDLDLRDVFESLPGVKAH